MKRDFNRAVMIKPGLALLLSLSLLSPAHAEPLTANTSVTTIQITGLEILSTKEAKITIRILQGYARKVASAYNLGKVVITTAPADSKISLVSQFPPSDGMAGAAGYHLLINGFPVSYVITKNPYVPTLNLSARYILAIASHELAEMLTDPNMLQKTLTGKWVEIADEGIRAVYDGYAVANFKLPNGKYEWRESQ